MTRPIVHPDCRLSAALVALVALVGCGRTVEPVSPEDAAIVDAAIEDAADAWDLDAAPADAPAPPRDIAAMDAGTRADAVRDAAVATDIASDVVRDARVRDAVAVDARVALPVPAALVRRLSTRPYVEQSCRQTTWRDWPYPAQRCTYNNGLVVTVANPSPERVARWIVDAGEQIRAVASLRTRDPANYEACLLRIADHMLSQSSRIFPLEGQVDEGTVYNFLKGVTYGAGSGFGFCSTCYCRINSLSRAQWCSYVAATRGTTVSACLQRFGGNTGWNDAWANHCLANHRESWTSDENPHFRAMAWGANDAIEAAYPRPGTLAGSTILAAVRGQYPVY